MCLAVPWSRPNWHSFFLGDCPPPPPQLPSQLRLEGALGCSFLVHCRSSQAGDRRRWFYGVMGGGDPKEPSLAAGILEVRIRRG